MQMGILLGWRAHKYLRLFSKCPETFHTSLGQSRRGNQLAHVLPVGGHGLIRVGSPKTGLTGPDVCSCVVAAEIIEKSQKVIPPILRQTPEVEVPDEVPHSGVTSL